MPEISVIMPVYNAQDYLHESIESILEQSYHDFEFIILNDGSIDESKNIISSYHDMRIRYFEHETNRGIAYSLNYCLSVAKGNFIARMDADDIAMPNRLLLQLLFLQKNSQIQVAGSFIKILDKQKEIIKKFPVSPKNICWQLIKKIPVAHPTIMFRKSLVQSGDYAYNNHYYPCEDYQLWCKLALKYNIANIPLPLLVYRQHAKQVSVLLRKQQLMAKKNISKRYTGLLFRIGNKVFLDQCYVFLTNTNKQSIVINFKVIAWLYSKALRISRIHTAAFLRFITLRFFKNLLLIKSQNYFFVEPAFVFMASSLASHSCTA